MRDVSKLITEGQVLLLRAMFVIIPSHHELQWVAEEACTASEIIVKPNVPARIAGYIVFRRFDDDEEDTVPQGAWVIKGHVYVTWTRTPLETDTIVHRLSALCNGNVVARDRVSTLNVYVKNLGEVRRDLVPEFLSRCCQEDETLHACYRFDSDHRPTKRSDGCRFESLASFLAHAIDHVQVDVLELLRQFDAYPQSVAWLRGETL